MVVPTKRNPRFFMSLLNASDSGARQGLFLEVCPVFVFGLPPTNDQTERSNVPNSFWTARKARAFVIAAAIFNLLRTIPASAGSSRTFFLSVQGTLLVYD